MFTFNLSEILYPQLTHGLTEKELQRKGVTDLNITDSLKQRVKLYISAYMSKFGPIYHKT